MHKSYATSRSPVFLLTAFFILGLAGIDGAHAVTVINPSFELPVAGPPQNYISDPATTSGVGWTFSDQPLGSNSGVQQSGVAFGGPVTTDGHQTGWILNLSTISQSIDFAEGGDCTVSFKVAYGSFSNESISVTLDGVELQRLTPPSNTSFSEVTARFSTTSGAHTLGFAGVGPMGTPEQAVVFIDEVAITGPLPQITKGPDDDLDPTSTVTLTVKHAGKDKGRVRIHFRDASLVTFEHSTSKDNLDLDVPGTWNDDGTITTEQILQASSVGAVDAQTVDITVIAADGQESKAVQKPFHNKAVITGLSGKMVPSGKFNLKGWNFGDAGKVTALFTFPAFGAFPDSNGSNTNLDVTIPSWSPAAVKAQFQPITGVMQQVVLITLTTKDNRQSNTWPGIFVPTMELQQFSFHHTKVLTCSNDGVSNLCLGANSSGNWPGGDCFGGFSPDWPPSRQVLPDGAFMGIHIGCFGGDSDNGTDAYEADIKNGWVIDRFDFLPTTTSDPYWENNASINYQQFPLPFIGLIVNVTWHIGATGGVGQYYAWITLKGPKGVPYN
jgi:hypothetical protein